MRKPTPKPTAEELASFSALPNEAYVAQPTVVGLTATSPATVWRMCRDGRLPQPVKITARAARWNVGELRKALNAFSTTAAR